MKTTLTLAMVSLILGSATVVEAGPVNSRLDNQRDRIAQGVHSGSLTRGETSALLREQRQIRTMAEHFRSDGRITPSEFSRLRYRQDVANRHIYRQKHDAQRRR